MTIPQSRFHGLFIPHVTPFGDDGALDLESLERLTTHQTSIHGVAGLVSCARIGEGPVLGSRIEVPALRVARSLGGRGTFAAIETGERGAGSRAIGQPRQRVQGREQLAGACASRPWCG